MVRMCILWKNEKDVKTFEAPQTPQRLFCFMTRSTLGVVMKRLDSLREKYLKKVVKIFGRVKIID